MKFTYYVWGLYLISFPFYLLPEGNPQIADVFGALLIIVNLKHIILGINTNSYTKLLFFFVIYTFIVNTVWMLILGDILMIKHCVFYLYCYFLMLMVYNNLDNQQFLKISFKAISITLFLQLLLWPLIRTTGVRSQLFFNNPNQLALWSISLLVIVYILSRLIKEKQKITPLLLIICSVFVVISASRAALGGVILFWMFYIIKSKKQLFITIIASIIIGLFINYSFKIDLTKIAALEYNIERFSSHSVTSDQSFGGRGYERIRDYPQYLLFGAGEGAYERFNNIQELHSNLPNIIFCYGVIGLIIYILAFSILIKSPTIEILAIFFVIAIFSSVHMTMRIPLFWISLLFLIHLHENKIKTLTIENTD